ncbi:MAG: transcriptional regulator [Rhodospirillales bacterium]
MLTSAATHAADGLKLLMFEQDACIWCEAWNRQIGPAYPNSWEGKVAPLDRVDIHNGNRRDYQIRPWPRHTPTFVLIENGREVGRITGYPGEDFFWPMLDEIFGRAGIKEPSG